MKMDKATQIKSPPWIMKELEEELKNISENKSSDPHGINRSIFHNNSIGLNLKESLLIMFNKMKNNGEIPNFMKVVVCRFYQ